MHGSNGRVEEGEAGKDSRQGLVIIDEVGHAEEFLDRVHHFGGFCSEQLAIQHQDLQGARHRGEVSLAPALLS